MSDFASLLAMAQALVDERLAALAVATKGEAAGHPFRGNQWTGGAHSGASDSEDTNIYTGEESHAQRMSIVTGAAHELGIDVNRVEYGGAGYPFKVGDDDFIAAGQFNPADGKITLYNGALRANETELKGIVAHEVQHAKYHEVMNEYHADIRKILDDPRDTITPSGKVRDEFKGEFQTYSAIQPYIEPRAKELIKKDGITPYSTSYWKAYSEGKVHFDTAVNETLAEVAHQKAVGINVGIPTVWRQMYNDVDLQYHRLQRTKK